MARKLIAALLTMMIVAGFIPFAVMADTAPPDVFSAPEHFGVSSSSNYSDQVMFFFSAPNDVRDYVEKWKADDPDNHINFTIYYQVDYRIDNGSWHYSPDWDSPKTIPSGINIYSTIGSQDEYNCSEINNLSHIFRDNADLNPLKETGWEYFKNHSMTFRARFAHSFDYGKTFVLSPWSNEFTLSADVVADYNKLINHAPSLISADLKASAGGEPYFLVKLGRFHGDIQDLNGLSGNNIRVEVWMRRAVDKEFKYIKYEWANKEIMRIDASDYFSVDGSEQSYAAESYEIKVRYALDLRKYKQSGYADSSSSVDIYSPFSNVISHNMPSWSNASSWATEELKKADREGLIPGSLKGADLTRPITREEFAELAVTLYETTTGKKAVPASPNPFPDTNNPEILKAFKLGLTTGISTRDGLIYAPKELINREQCATMLYRALKVIAPHGNYSIAGIKDFPDQKDISSWAVEGTKYMSKLGIIKGDNNGYFVPRAITPEQVARGYGMATREAALLMSVRSFEQIKSGALGIPSGDGSAQTPQVTETNPLVGTWVLGDLSGGRFNSVTGRYEGGAFGLGQIYTFKADGTFTSLVIWSNATFFTGKYSIKDGVITITDRVAEVSNNDGKTWGAKEPLPDASIYFTIETDAMGKYLVLGAEGVVPPVNLPSNALKYRWKN